MSNFAIVLCYAFTKLFGVRLFLVVIVDCRVCLLVLWFVCCLSWLFAAICIDCLLGGCCYFFSSFGGLFLVVVSDYCWLLFG